VIDARGKIPAGILEGNFMNLGNMEEYLAAKADEDSGTFTGKYCLVTFHISVGTSKSSKAARPLYHDISILLNSLPSNITALIACFNYATRFGPSH
jgi:hypothetical protein